MFRKFMQMCIFFLVNWEIPECIAFKSLMHTTVNIDGYTKVYGDEIRNVTFNE